jgi:S-adenosylmethionine-dependent methyltransferase
VTDVFGDRSAQWAQWQAEPWGRVRYAVVAEVLRRTVTGTGLRVLDVGGGDGQDGVPLAAAGHSVTVLDRSPDLLGRAAEHGFATRVADLDDEPADLQGAFDVVLCHNVLHYLDDVAGAVDRLTAFLAPGGVVSLMAPTPAMDVLAAAVRRLDPAEALALLDARTVHGQTFDHPMNRLESATVEEALQRSGLTVTGRYGVRCVTDLVTDDDRKRDPEFFARLLALELALCDREPFRRTGRFWLLTARR